MGKFLDGIGVGIIWNKVNNAINAAMISKQEKEIGKGLSTNDYNDAAKTTVDLMPETIGEIYRIIKCDTPVILN